MSTPGRPTRNEAPSAKLVAYRVTHEEYERLKRAASVNLQIPSDFAREVALDAAAEQLEEDASVDQ